MAQPLTAMDPAWLRESMDRHLWTQKELAKRAGVSEFSVRRALAGQGIYYRVSLAITKALMEAAPVPLVQAALRNGTKPITKKKAKR